jgi:PKD repeat protein
MDKSASNITAWQWDFDNDGNVDSTEQNPVHTFVLAGKYTVSLTVTNEEGTDKEIKESFIVVTDNTSSDDWNPWNDSTSLDGSKITTSELQKGIECWLYDLSAPTTGATITTPRLQQLIGLWLES